MTSMIEQTEHVLAVPDLARSVRWWREAMGFQTVFETPGWVFMALGGARLRLGECPDALPAHALGTDTAPIYGRAPDARLPGVQGAA